MIRINNSKFPTEQQLKNIISNLKEKYPKDKFVISLEVDSTRQLLYYFLYRLDHKNKKEYYPIVGVEWNSFLNEYREYMKGE